MSDRHYVFLPIPVIIQVCVFPNFQYVHVLPRAMCRCRVAALMLSEVSCLVMNGTGACRLFKVCLGGS